MNRNSLRWITFLIILMIISSPIFNSSMVNKENTTSSKNNIPYSNTTGQNTIKLAIYHAKADGSINFTIKELITEEYEEVIYNITKKISQTKTYDKPFENIFDILRENNLIDEDISLNDIFSDKTSIVYNSTAYNVSVMKPFLAHFSPIIAVGMGFGAGIGDKFGSVTGLLYSGGVIGLGGVLCLDALEKTIYVQFTFTFPLLFHVLSGFVGVMMFPVAFDFISANYLPLFVYSNFIAIGYSALAIGFPFPLVYY